MQYKYLIPLSPIPLQRARHVLYRTRPFDPQKQEKLAYCIYIQNQKPDKPPLQGPLRLDAYFYFKVQPSRIKRALKEQWNYHIFKPDGDNCIKMICDVCQDSGVFANDSVVAVTYYEKLWTFDNARTEFILTEL